MEIKQIFSRIPLSKLLKTITLFFVLPLLISLFIVAPDALALTKPTLLSPADNAQITTASVTFSWSHPYNDQYELKIKDSGGTIKYASGKTSSKSKTVNLSSIPLTYGNTYKWYVVVYANGQEDSSVDRWFTYKFAGRVNVNSGVSVSPATVTVGQNFTVAFTLKEYQGGTKTFEYVELWIQDGGGSDLYAAQRWSNVSFSANQQRSYSTTTNLDPTKGRSAGTYRAIVRGKVARDVPFNFGVVSGSGAVNPKTFTAVAAGFTWPVDPTNPTIGHKDSRPGACSNTTTLPCFWISDEDQSSGNIWYDLQAFQKYNYTGYGWHLGADYNRNDGQDLNQPIYPTYPGTISKVLETGGCPSDWGRIVFMKHNTPFGTYTSMYAHVNWLPSGKPTEDPNHQINTSTPIAMVGTGATATCSVGKYGAHLHFEIRRGDSIKNYPDKFIGPGYTPAKCDTNCPQGQVDPNNFIAAHHAPCATITAANWNAVDNGTYAPPFDVFLSNYDLLINPSCSGTDTHTMQISIGKAGDPDVIAYKQGYFFSKLQSAWLPFTATCSGTEVSGQCQGEARAILTDAGIDTTSKTNPTYVIGYTCKKINGVWKCGCRDQTCANSYWQIQGAGR